MKACLECGEIKDYTEFPISSRSKKGKPYYRKICKECYSKLQSIKQSKKWRDDHSFRETHRKRCAEYEKSDKRKKYKKSWRDKTFSDARYKYNITMVEAAEIYSRGCEVCGSMKDLCIDHDHSTGEVRGCLCSKCNTALGMMRDSPELLERLAEYVRRGGNA